MAGGKKGTRGTDKESPTAATRALKKKRSAASGTRARTAAGPAVVPSGENTNPKDHMTGIDRVKKIKVKRTKTKAPAGKANDPPMKPAEDEAKSSKVTWLPFKPEYVVVDDVGGILVCDGLTGKRLYFLSRRLVDKRQAQARHAGAPISKVHAALQGPDADTENKDAPPGNPPPAAQGDLQWQPDTDKWDRYLDDGYEASCGVLRLDNREIKAVFLSMPKLASGAKTVSLSVEGVNDPDVKVHGPNDNMDIDPLVLSVLDTKVNTLPKVAAQDTRTNLRNSKKAKIANTNPYRQAILWQFRAVRTGVPMAIDVLEDNHHKWGTSLPTLSKNESDGSQSKVTDKRFSEFLKQLTKPFDYVTAEFPGRWLVAKAVFSLTRTDAELAAILNDVKDAFAAAQDSARGKSDDHLRVQVEVRLQIVFDKYNLPLKYHKGPESLAVQGFRMGL